VLYGHVGRAAIRSRIKIMNSIRRIIFSFNWRVVQMSRTIPMEWHNNVDPTRVLSLAIVTLGIVWDSAVTRRLAIVMLIIAIVCFSLALFFFLHRR